MPVTDLVSLAAESVERFADRPLFGERVATTWRWTTYSEWSRLVDRCRSKLARLGVARDERVGIVARNGVGWATTAYASCGLGASFVPMYEAQRPEDWEHVLLDSAVVVAVCRTSAIAATIAEMRSRLPALRDILVMETSDDDPRSFLDSVDAAAPAAVRPAPDDLACTVYTSGTTGKPKGVMLSHANLTSNVMATIDTFPFRSDDRTVSFLPWAHVYGQVCELHILIAAGASTAFNTDPQHLLDDLREVKPTLLVAVPRIFNRLYASVRSQIDSKPRIVRAIFWGGLARSIRRRRGERLGLGARLLCWIAGFLFAKVRKKLGGRLKYAISGSATLSRDVAELVDGIGIEVYEGYGLTETSPIVTFNRPGHRKLGSVGLPIANVRIEIDTTRGDNPGEGEIVIHGPNVMKGYHARPEENARVFTADGGLRTGDLGRIDEDGYLFITGRIKEQYKLENGKYVMPSLLEEQLAMSPFVTQVMLHGAGHPFNVALVALDTLRVRAWAEEQGISLDSDLAHDERVHTLIQNELDRLSKSFRSYERPRDCVLVESAFSIENGLLTPTLKVKRREVTHRFGVELEALYQRPSTARATAAVSLQV